MKLSNKAKKDRRRKRGSRRLGGPESMETRRLLAADGILQFGGAFIDGAPGDRYECSEIPCSTYHVGEADETTSVGMGITNISSGFVSRFSISVEGQLVPSVFEADSVGSCLAVSALAPGGSCSFGVAFNPTSTDSAGTYYGGDVSLASIVVSGRTRGGGSPVEQTLIIPLAGTKRAPTAPPIAEAGSDVLGVEEQRIIFDASDSYDPEGEPLTYSWDFGDGQTAVTSSPIIEHAYEYGGAFAVTLTVDDGDGGTAIDTVTATITEINDAPVADAGGVYTGFEGLPINLDAGGSFDFDNLDGTASNDQTLTYTWDFGDGNGLTSVDPHVQHTYATDGIYPVTLTVSDGIDSTNASTTANVEVAPQGDPNDIYVAGVDFDSRTRGKKVDHRIAVAVRRDDDADGVAESSDTIVAEVNVRVELRDSNGDLIDTSTGMTNSSGVFYGDWIRGLSPGSYTVEVELLPNSYQWNHALDAAFSDDDFDGLPEYGVFVP